MKKLRSALYGASEHQIYALLKNSPCFELAAAACIPESKLMGISAFEEGRVALYESLHALLEGGDEEEIGVLGCNRVPFPGLLARHPLFGEPLPLTEEKLHPLCSVLRRKWRHAQ